MPPAIPDIRSVRARTSRDVWNWIYLYTGIRIANRPVCPEHRPPWDAFSAWSGCSGPRPPQSLLIGPRGGGKSFLSALSAHHEARHSPGYGCRILGGSLAQSGQIHEAIEQAVIDGLGPFGESDADTIADRTQQFTRYRNESEIRVLAASRKSVRGPHVPDLRLDEIDEMDPEILSSAVGMAMDRRKMGWLPSGTWGPTGETVASAITMTSTWHRMDGPVGEMIEKAKAVNEKSPGSFPVFKFCSFCVLEKCPESLSGPNLERCPECPLVKWCHDVPDGGPPRAKRGNGHYTVRSLIQKAQAVSERMFSADYLCRGPKVEGLYFPGFDPEPNGKHVSTEADYNPNFEVHMSMDPGNHVGVVLFQKRDGRDAFGTSVVEINVFGEYYADNHPGGAETVAREIVAMESQRCNGVIHRRYIDPAGGSRTAIGPTAIAEYERGGLRGFLRWTKGKGSVQEGLILIEGLLGAAGGHVGLRIHPRCKRLITAIQNFRREKRGATFLDQPEDPQHPHEDMVEALRGGLRMVLPLGRTDMGQTRTVHPGRFST